MEVPAACRVHLVSKSELRRHHVHCPHLHLALALDIDEPPLHNIKAALVNDALIGGAADVDLAGQAVALWVCGVVS